MMLVAWWVQGSIYFYLGIFAAAGFSVYQQYQLKDREKNAYFQAFLNNNWVGMSIFVGILLDYLPG